MKVKLQILSAFLVLTCQSARGQNKTYSKGETIEYKVLRDDPYNLTPLVLSLDFLTADTWNTNSYMGINIRPEINIPKYGQINIDYRRAYIDGNTGKSLTTGTPLRPSGSLRKHRSWEITAGINLFHRDEKKDIDVTVASELVYSGSKTDRYKVYYIKVPGTLRTTLQARVGLQRFNSPVEFYSLEKEGSNIRLSAGDTTFQYRSSYKAADGYNWIDARTMMKMSLINVGLSLKRITNLWVENLSDASGVSGEAKTYDLYGDVLLNLGNTFGALQYKGGELLVSHANVRKLGWRLGWSAHFTRTSFLSYKVEFGARPTFAQDKKRILGDNAFLLLTAGWSFGFGGKLSAKKLNRIS